MRITVDLNYRECKFAKKHLSWCEWIQKGVIRQYQIWVGAKKGFKNMAPPFIFNVNFPVWEVILYRLRVKAARMSWMVIGLFIFLFI
jgi:hypothetical protein